MHLLGLLKKGVFVGFLVPFVPKAGGTSSDVFGKCERGVSDGKKARDVDASVLGLGCFGLYLHLICTRWVLAKFAVNH
jgi:hypothetical protein